MQYWQLKGVEPYLDEKPLLPCWYNVAETVMVIMGILLTWKSNIEMPASRPHTIHYHFLSFTGVR